MIKKICLCLFITVGSILSIIAQSALPSLSITITPNEYHPIAAQDKKESVSQNIPYALGTIVSSWKMRGKGIAGFQAGTCTDYAASKKPYRFIRNGKRIITGNAKERLKNAKKAGALTGKTPKIGSIAVFAPGKGAGSYGHVAYVEMVGNDGKIIVTDMNYKGKNIVTRRVVSAIQAKGYIY